MTKPARGFRCIPVPQAKLAGKADDNSTMGNVGISFGSPTSGQGFDVSSTVDQIVTNMQAVETPWKNQLTALQAQDTALTTIGTDLSSLSTALQTLTDFQGVLSEKQGSSSDTNVLDLTGASNSAVAGSHTVAVNQLAVTSSYYSTDIGASDVLSGSLIINGQTVTLSDGTATDGSGNTIPQNNTLATLASYINNGSYGVTAQITTDSSGQRLSLVSKTSGAKGSITVHASALTDTTTSANNPITFQGQAGQDASMTVDGIPMTSSSNTVTTAIPGVTFQLLSATPGTTVQVEITNDNSAVETAVNNFVSAYNTVAKDLNTQEGKDSSGNPEPLDGNPALALLQEQLSQALNFTQSSGAITSLTQLGLEASASADGTITLNTNTLDNALNSNFSDVIAFLQPSASFTSFGGNLTSALDHLGNNAPFGITYMALQQNSSIESQLNDNIDNEETLISGEKTQLTSELNQANYTLQQIPEQLQYVDEMYSAITGYNQKNG